MSEEKGTRNIGMETSVHIIDGKPVTMLTIGIYDVVELCVYKENEYRGLIRRYRRTMLYMALCSLLFIPLLAIQAALVPKNIIGIGSVLITSAIFVYAQALFFKTVAFVFTKLGAAEICNKTAKTLQKVQKKTVKSFLKGRIEESTLVGENLEPTKVADITKH